MTFTILSVVISVVAVLFLLRPLLSRKKEDATVTREDINVQSAAARLKELKQDLESGEVSEAEFQKHRLELETSAVDDLRNQSITDTQSRKGNVAIAIVLALFVPLLAIGIYQKIGSHEALEIEKFANAGMPEQIQELEKALAKAEKEILGNPDDVEGRIALGQVYFEMERYTDASTVYAELNQMRPNDPDILVNYAEALARTHGNRLVGEPVKLLNKALELNPNHERALWLAGFAEAQADNQEQALAHWRHLLAGMEPETEIYRQVEALIKDVESGGSASTSAAKESDDAKTVSLQVNVTIAAEFRDKINPDTTLFVFARASEGPPMPLAVHRGIARDLPLAVTLDDSMAMMPSMSLSQFATVVVGARLSSNGQPQGQTGDYEGFTDVIEVGSGLVVDVLIDSIKP